MSTEEKSPYFSKRIRIGDVTSPKDLVGTKDFTVEITMGNQDAIIIRDKTDVAKTENKNLFDIVEEIYADRDAWVKKRGFVFVDQLPKGDKDGGAKL